MTDDYVFMNDTETVVAKIIFGADEDGFVYVRVNSGQWKLHYIYRDYQGSVTDITDASGTVVHRMRYSPWGKLLHTDGTPYTRSEELSTDYDRLLFLGRGYTGHEYLPWFGLVNMNARLYDPAIGRFLSPDPYVQMPDFSQNFNRYSYCLNNPLVYVDENGEFIHLIIGAVVGGVANVISNWEMIKAKGFWTGLGYFGVGAAVGAGSAALGGWVAGVTQSAGIITGAAVGAGTGAVTGAASSVTLNGLNNVIGGQNFWNGWQQSAISGAIGGISGGIAGGMKGYELAKEGGKNMWWGGDVKHGRTQWSFFTTEKPYETISWDIKNVGSKSLNDCVPTSFAEADDYFGGNTTYEQYKTTTNYQQDVGVMASNRPNAYGRVLSKQFTGAPMPDPVSVLADPQQVLSIKKSGNLIHTNMPHSGGMGHVDNLRSIKYYHSGKVVMNFRIGSYRLSSVNGNWWFYTLNGLKQL